MCFLFYVNKKNRFLVVNIQKDVRQEWMRYDLMEFRRGGGRTEHFWGIGWERSFCRHFASLMFSFDILFLSFKTVTFPNLAKEFSSGLSWICTPAFDNNL